MYNKFVIFVVFVALVQSCFCSVQSPTDLSFLSTDADCDLNKLATYQASSLKSDTESIDAAFGSVRRRLIEQVYNMTSSADYNSTAIVAKSLSQRKEAFDYFLTSVLIASRKTGCNAVDKARRISHKEFEGIYAKVQKLLAFIKSTNSTEAAKDRLNDHEKLVQASWTRIVQAITDSVRTCAEITSTEELEVIKKFEKRIGIALCKCAIAAVNSFRYYAYAFITNSSDTGLILNVEQEQHEADVVNRDVVGNMYSMLNTVYINSHLKKNGLVSVIAAIQSARISSTDRFNTTIETLFASMKGQLFAKSIGASPVREMIISLDEANVKYATAQWIAGTHQLLSSIQSDNASMVEATEKKFNANIRLIASTFLNKIVKNSVGFTDVVSQIKALADVVEAKAEKYNTGIFELITNGKIFNSNVRSRIETHRSHASNHLTKGVVGGLAKAYLIMVDALSGKSNITESIHTLITIKNQVIVAKTNMVNIISFAQITALIANCK